MPPSAYAEQYGRWGNSDDYVQACGPTRDKWMMMGTLGSGAALKPGAYWRYWDVILGQWYLDKESKGYSAEDLKIAWKYRVDGSNYIKKNCP